ncbi:uncharacterized protein LOC135948388 [Cloeon dipterum]|uniref:uncharacterized protein LOC135948388 n=1 Tax=Cloeon dipterum TaxID=197152 RepID=UPI0032207D03
MELLPTPPPLKKSKRRENQLKTDSNAFAEKDGACLSAEVEFEEMIIEHAQSLDDTPPNPIPTPSSIPALSNTDIDEDDCPPTNNEACHDKEPTASPQSVSGDHGGFNLMTLDKYSNEGVVPKCTTEDYQGTVLKNFELVKNKLASNGLALESLFTLYDQLRINLSNNAHEESTTKPVEDESFGLELPLKGPDEFDQLEKNLEDKSFYKKLVKATQKHILKVGLKLSGSKEAKIKKCIEATVMPWYFSPSLVKVSSKAGQGEKNIVKIAGTLFVSMIADAINVVAKDGIASREFVECVMGEYLRRVGSKLRQSVSAPKSVDRRKASFSPHKKTPLKKSSHVKKVKPVSLLLKLTTSPLSTPTKKRHEDLDASSNRTENSSEEIDSESHHASGSENDVSLSDTELRFSS